jgi:beta-lactamase regulating signal transducer with metallopeptidase domain
VNEDPSSEHVELLRLRFDQEKWKAEIEMSERDHALKEREQALKERQQESSRWTNPLVVAIFAAALAALGNAVVAVVNGSDKHMDRTQACSKR